MRTVFEKYVKKLGYTVKTRQNYDGGIDIRAIKILDNHVGIPAGKQVTIEFLINTLAFNHHQALDYYKLWYLNQEDIIPYEEMEDIDRGSTFLTTTLDRIRNSEDIGWTKDSQ